MAASDTARVNQNAVMAAQAMLGSDALPEEAAIELIDAVRVHIERPYQLALLAAQKENAALKARISELTSAAPVAARTA